MTYGLCFGAPLSKREIEVLKLRATGYECSRIATTLYICEKTVDEHLARIARKLATRNPALLALWAVHLGYVNPAEVETLGEMRWRRNLSGS